MSTLDLHTRLARRPSTLWTLVRYRLLGVRNQLANLHRESRLKIAVVTGVGLAFWIGLYFLFFLMFEFLDKHGGPWRVSLSERVFSLFFMALMFMLMFSNAVISFGSLFEKEETAFLFSLPLRHDTIFLYKLIEGLVFSSWAIFAIGVPMALGFAHANALQFSFYPLLLLLTIPFVLLPAALGNLLGLVLTRIAPRKRKQILGIALMAGLVIGGYIVLALLNAQRARHVSPEAQDSSVRSVLAHLHFTRQPMLPNYWMTEAVLAISERQGAWRQTAGLYFAALSASAVFALTFAWFVAGAIYDRTYTIASGSGFVRQVLGRTRWEQALSPLLSRYPQVLLLLVKDIKTFFRDPAQWSQVLIFFGILTLYIGNLRNLSYPLERPFYQNLIAFLNLGATCMTLATLTSRFIFPMISLEGTRFWILGLVPLRRRDIMLSKFVFSLCGTLALSLSLVLLSNYMLRGDTQVLLIQLFTAGVVSVGLSGLSVGMGAIFPSFHERNPSKIVSGFGGTLTLILSIGLVLFSVIGEAIACHKALGSLRPEDGPIGPPEMTPFVWAVIGAVGVLNLLAAYIPMKLGVRALERVEF